MSILNTASEILDAKDGPKTTPNKKLSPKNDDYEFSASKWKKKLVKLRRDVNVSETEIIIDGKVLDIDFLKPIPLPDSLAGSPVRMDEESIRKSSDLNLEV